MFSLVIAPARRAFSRFQYAGVMPRPHKQVLVSDGFSVVRCGCDQAHPSEYHRDFARENTLRLCNNWMSKPSGIR